MIERLTGEISKDHDYYIKFTPELEQKLMNLDIDKNMNAESR